MELDHTATPSDDSIPKKPKNTTSKRRFRWWWLLSIPVAGGIVILSIFFPQVMGPVGLAVLSPVVAWVLGRISKGKGA